MIFPTFCRLELRECHGAWSLFSTNKKCCCCCLVPKLCLGCPSTVAHQAPLSLARILELVVISFSRRSFRPWDWEPKSPALAGRFFTAEPPGKPQLRNGGYRKASVPRSPTGSSLFSHLHFFYLLNMGQFHSWALF